MQNDKFLKPEQVAEILNITTGHLANLRHKYRKIKSSKSLDINYLKWIELPSGIIRYKESDVKQWIESKSIV